MGALSGSQTPCCKHAASGAHAFSFFLFFWIQFFILARNRALDKRYIQTVGEESRNSANGGRM